MEPNLRDSKSAGSAVSVLTSNADSVTLAGKSAKGFDDFSDVAAINEDVDESTMSRAYAAKMLQGGTTKKNKKPEYA